MTQKEAEFFYGNYSTSLRELHEIDEIENSSSTTIADEFELEKSANSTV